MTAAEREREIAGAWANVVQKAARLDASCRAVMHDGLLHRAAVDEWMRLVSERHTDASPASGSVVQTTPAAMQAERAAGRLSHTDAPASTPAEPWCAGNPARRTEELL